MPRLLLSLVVSIFVSRSAAVARHQRNSRVTRAERKPTPATLPAPPPDEGLIYGRLPDEGLSIVMIVWGQTPSARACQAAQVVSFFNPSIPVYLMSDEDSCHPGNLCRSNVHHVSLQSFNNDDDQVTAFKNTYIHISVNWKDGEKNCFIRHFVLRKFMEKRGLSNVLFMDGDILLTSDVYRSLQLPARTNFWTLTEESTYFVIWSYSALENFCKHMETFYQRPMKEIAKDVNEFGGQNQRLQRRLEVSKPKNWPQNTSISQFSDMYMLRSFIHTRPEYLEGVRVRSNASCATCGLQPQFKALRNLHEILGNDPNTCATDTLSWESITVNCQQNWRRTCNCQQISGQQVSGQQVSGQQVSLQISVPFYHGAALVGMHLQGGCKQELDAMLERMHLPPKSHDSQKRTRQSLGDEAQAIISAVNANTNTKVEGLESKNDILGEKVEHLDTRVTITNTRIDQHDARFEALESDVKALRVRLETGAGTGRPAETVVAPLGYYVGMADARLEALGLEIQALRARLETGAGTGRPAETVVAPPGYYDGMADAHYQALESDIQALRSRLETGAGTGRPAENVVAPLGYYGGMAER